MFPFLRFSAVTASIIVVSSAFGFGLATTLLSADETQHFDNGPGVVSPGSQTRENVETRSISGFKSVVLRSRSLSVMVYPAMNPDGPAPSLAHAKLGASRNLVVSACLMAMN